MQPPLRARDFVCNVTYRSQSNARYNVYNLISVGGEERRRERKGGHSRVMEQGEDGREGRSSVDLQDFSI